ncbi:hypothetical protein G5I_13322 [Acromyrmex echinatior]|uniref:Uncharacterized protein n=1 Tax=Acromyrmex echinatior TaxID=103372 RepID=F4X4Q3_ACREC|nr:hypothetical protein G5I_13322 [Acromyrmex echinatior]
MHTLKSFSIHSAFWEQFANAEPSLKLTDFQVKRVVSTLCPEYILEISLGCLKDIRTFSGGLCCYEPAYHSSRQYRNRKFTNLLTVPETKRSVEKANNALLCTPTFNLAGLRQEICINKKKLCTDLDVGINEDMVETLSQKQKQNSISLRNRIRRSERRENSKVEEDFIFGSLMTFANSREQRGATSQCEGREDEDDNVKEEKGEEEKEVEEEEEEEEEVE